MGMSSVTKKISIAADSHEDMDINDGSVGEQMCVKALFKDDDKCIDTRSKDSHRSKDDIKHDRHDVSKNFKIPRNFMGKKPAEAFRTDFITAMKLPEFHQFAAGDYLTLTDAWRQEWEKGVQVPVNPDRIPTPLSRKVSHMVCNSNVRSFLLPTQRITFNEKAFDRSTASCDYDLDDIDMQWLNSVRSLHTLKKGNAYNELTMERAITWFERQCFEKMAHEVATKEGLSIEYDETTTCHVCLSPDAEDGNEIIFCDACNMCAHQHCYGVLDIPEGNWLCNPCSRGNLSPPCCLCPNKGGAMKRMKDSLEWIHVICAWWVPEVKIEDTRYIERITKDKIPTNRWNLTCSICWEKTGACIQCSVKRCVRAYHITCAVKSGLEMKTVVDPEKDDVQHISFCSKHCSSVPPEINPLSNRCGEDVENNRQKELRKLQGEFYSLVSVNKVCRELRLSKEVIRKMLAYWTMKRRHNNNEPLIPLSLEQEEKLSGKQGIVLLHQQKTLEMERFLLLRQDLERLRNLCYMIVRREKMRKEIHRCSIDIFMKQNEILLDKNEDLSGDNIDFIRHRTTNFTSFSENYETEKEHRSVHGSHLKLFDDSAGEEDLLKSHDLEHINPEDYDRPLCTLIEQKKCQTQKADVKDTPRIFSKKNTSIGDTKRTISKVRKTVIPTRHSTRLDIHAIDINLNDMSPNDSKNRVSYEMADKLCVKNMDAAYSGIVPVCTETTATANEMQECFEVNQSGILSGETSSSNVRDQKMETEVNHSPVKTLFEVNASEVCAKTGQKITAPGRHTHKLSNDNLNSNTNDIFNKTISKSNSCVASAEKVELILSETEGSTAEITTELNEPDSNGSLKKTITERNIFEFLSPKREDSDYSSWSTINDSSEVGSLYPGQVDEDVKPILLTDNPLLTSSHAGCSIKTVSTMELTGIPLTASSPMEGKGNVFDTCNEYRVHQNDLPAFSDENKYATKTDMKCNISSSKPMPNNCAISNGSIFKRKNKRLRNILKYEGKARRNSPRLHQQNDLVTSSNNTELASPSKGFLGERLSKLIIETKRRRLNSRSDYPTDIKDEPPDYVRITRSRGIHSQVTGTA